VPFFWSQHYDVPINYVGRHRRWDEIVIDGDITAKDCLLEYKRKGRLLAVASIFRDLASLQAEVKMEREATWGAGSHYLSCANNVPARKPSPSTACWSKCGREPRIDAISSRLSAARRQHGLVFRHGLAAPVLRHVMAGRRKFIFPVAVIGVAMLPELTAIGRGMFCWRSLH